MIDGATLIFELIVLIFSVMIHEISHGYVAEYLGDPTARLAGRLTMNPVSHFSLFGMVIFPILSYWAWGVPVGSAKPVPYNPQNLKNPVSGGGLIALAGPVSNLMIAGVFGIILRAFSAFGAESGFVDALISIVYLNVLLAVFNLFPVPPLDGSKVINLILPGRASFYLEHFWNKVMLYISQNQLLFLIILFFSFRYILSGVFFVIQPIINLLFVLIVGQPSIF